MKVVSHMSGGFDSAASTIMVAEAGHEFRTLMIDLGQPYAEQERAAVVELEFFLRGRYPSTYYGHSTLRVDMALTQVGQVVAYIPVRNLVIGAMSANFALSIGYDTIAVGNKTLELRPGDPYCFNDCSREFYTELGKLATFASQGSNIDFIMPLIGPNGPLTKREVVEYVSAHGFDVRKLWSCYADRVRPCGECYHCAEIKAAGVWDMVS